MTGEAHHAFVGLGANLGDASGTLHHAVEALSRASPRQLRVLRVSSFYASAPVEAEGPEFVNAVAELSTSLEPHDLLAVLQSIENDHGRQRPYRNAPRTLDLDLLLYDDIALESPTLVLPHPRMHQRAFVLWPLAELAPQLHLPGHGPLRPLIDAVADQPIRRIEDGAA